MSKTKSTTDHVGRLVQKTYQGSRSHDILRTARPALTPWGEFVIKSQATPEATLREGEDDSHKLILEFSLGTDIALSTTPKDCICLHRLATECDIKNAATATTLD